MGNWNAISCVSLEALAPTGALVIIAPHPDDETLGCGGLIARARDAGREVRVVVLTNGAGSHPASQTYSAQQVAALRQEELRLAIEALGLHSANLVELALPDGGLTQEGPKALARRIRQALGATVVGAIFAPGEDDPHPDHQTAASAARLLAADGASLRWSYPVRAHVIEAFLDKPGDLVRLDISLALERKRAAIACHVSQLGALIQDDPEGFHLNPNDLHQHTQAWELFRLGRACELADGL